MKHIDSRACFAGCAAVVLCEVLFAYVAPHDKARAVWALLALRLGESGLLMLVALKLGSGLETLGLAPSTWKNGVFRGTLWCLGFACLAALGMAVFYLTTGKSPLIFFPNPVSKELLPALAYLLGAGLIGPIAEELFFRGFVFGFFRKWGAWTAILGSALLFVLCHNAGNRIPVTQAVGGLVFAYSYEREKSLLVPLMIHMSGNLALAGAGYMAKSLGA